MTARYKDEIARINRETFAREKQAGKPWTIPWLDLDVSAFRAYRAGETTSLPKPFCEDPVDRIMMERVEGLNVLCLAGGGGQQSAVFSLLGADVTVLDLTPEQLKGDELAAEHYGYVVSILQGDMRDLSDLPAVHFDRVYQPISTLFVPNLKEVFSGVVRILKPGGLYSVDFAVPLLYLAENRGWDGMGYHLIIHQPYRRGAILESKDGIVNLSQGEFMGEFHHLLSDIMNGMIECGLVIRAVWESPRPDETILLAELQPGSEPHQNQFIPFGLTVLSNKPETS